MLCIFKMLLLNKLPCVCKVNGGGDVRGRREKGSSPSSSSQVEPRREGGNKEEEEEEEESGRVKTLQC